ncbi:MAG: hypothetical protein JKY25_08420 [Robiginitomaculum sp.]|nr:hypothetical protein [Robiginitomaculum sp.]
MTTKIIRLAIGLAISVGFSAVLMTGCEENRAETTEVELKNINPTAEKDNPPTIRIAPLDLEDEAGFEKQPGLVESDLARHDFENFYMSSDGMQIDRNVTTNATGSYVVDKIQMKFNRYIGLYRTDTPVEAGVSFAGEAIFWTNPGEAANIVLQISNFCTAENPEATTVAAVITDQPQTIYISHTFANSHGCALLRVTNVEKGGAILFGSSLSLNPQ